MKDCIFLKIILALFLFLPKINYAINPPIITATGNQTYCPGTSLKIVETISITNDPAEPDTDAIYIQISSGYINGQDRLTLSNPAAHSNITTTWDIAAGKLKLHSPSSGTKIPYTDFVSAINDVEFSNSSTSPSGTRNFSITIGQANYLPSTGHYYQYIEKIGIKWTDAKTAAESLNYYGLKGYLATLLSLEEAKLCGEQANGAGWIGGSDAAKEGEWRWVTGPEGLTNGGTGIVFWNGTGNGSTPNFAYWNTSNNEPNNLGDEDYAHITAPGVGISGSWNDLSNTGGTSGDYQPKGYIVEYGGLPGDPTLQISASTQITIPKITSTTPSSRCNSGSVTLEATASAGTINWYDSETGGTLLGTGDSFTTPILLSTTTYYVDASTSSCSNAARTAIIATIITPTITSTTPASRCDTGIVTLQALASAGTINWYDAPIGGTLLGTGTSFTTTNITATKTYYVDVNTSTSCTSLTRTAITATVNNTPTITSTTDASRCDSGSVTLEATSSDGTINWYDTNGNNIATGNSYITPILNATTTYYVDAKSTGCNSPKTGITATIYPIDKTTEEVILCQGTTATLDASIPGMNYLWSPGGETSQTIVASKIGDYSVTISSPAILSCDSKKSFKVIEHPKPVIKEIIINENSITIELENPENYYEYSVDNQIFKNSNQFSYLPSGPHTAFVREKNLCNLTQEDFTIFTIAKYFTPNNDGFNDVWEIAEMKDFPNSSLSVFDRYGKLLKQLNYKNSGWNGTFNGVKLPADDYWYTLKIEDSKPEIKGHFTLKR